MKALVLATVAASLAACATTGMSGHRSAAVSATVIAFRPDGEVEVTQRAIEELARSAEAPVDYLTKLGIKAGKFSKFDVDSMKKELGSTKEFELGNAIELIRSTNERGGDSSSFNAFVDDTTSRYERVVRAVLLDADADALMRDARGLTEGTPAERNLAKQRVLVGLEQVGKNARRRAVVRRAARDWLFTIVGDYRFKASVELTVDVAGSDKAPLLIAERAYVSVAGMPPRAFVQRSRTCNPALDACRVAYSYALAVAEVGQAERELKREALDRSTLLIDLFVDGRPVHAEMPGKFIKIEGEAAE